MTGRGPCAGTSEAARAAEEHAFLGHRRRVHLSDLAAVLLDIAPLSDQLGLGADVVAERLAGIGLGRPFGL
ncbi:hypothetical protein PENTCL1PPCAC_10078, partial [Pristionchus entomophagus]